MTSKELKSEIAKVLDQFPDEVLTSVLKYLKMLSSKPMDKAVRAQNLRKIIAEDASLLEKLAK